MFFKKIICLKVNRILKLVDKVSFSWNIFRTFKLFKYFDFIKRNSTHSYDFKFKQIY
jgi:hypothetical protein